MKAIFSFAALLAVLAIVAVNVRNELRTTAQFAPASASAPASQASAPFGGSSSPGVAQFRQELGKTMQVVNDRAASAGGEADATK